MRHKVLLIGLDNDLHLDAAILELRKRNTDFVRLNPERINRHNTQIDIAISSGGVVASLHGYFGRLQIDEISSVWCRYALDAMNSAQVGENEKFSNEEFLVSLKGALQQIPPSRWINDPYVEARVDNKPHQLVIAAKCGLRVPPSVVSKNKAKLINFVRSNGACVIKPLGDVPLLSEAGGSILGSYAALLDLKTLESDAWDDSCPVFLQKQIRKDADIRVTVIDGRVFSALLHQDRNGKAETIDFRNASQIRTSAYQFPESEQKALVELIKNLGLRYASCDFCLQGEDLWFLEANVAGNYLWTELEAGLEITPAIVDALMNFDPL